MGALHPCIGSACMAWQWGPEIKNTFGVIRDGLPEEIWHWDPRGYPNYAGVVVREIAAEQKGYCGAFGKP